VERIVRLFTADPRIAFCMESNHRFHGKTPKTPPVTFLWTGVCEGTAVRMGKKTSSRERAQKFGYRKENFHKPGGFESSDSHEDSSQRKERRDDSPFTVAGGE
jgi:hypothetical protein